MKGIYEAYKAHKTSEIYKNYSRNQKIFDGKSSEVFYLDVLRRVKLEYMGVLNQQNQYAEYQRIGNVLTPIYRPFKDLVVGNNILGAVTKLYSELASNTEPTVSLEESEKDILKNIDLQDSTAEAVAVQSFAGKCLLRGYIENDKFYFDIIHPHQYFSKKSIISGIVESYVVFSEEKKNVKTEIYSEGKTEYRMFRTVSGIWEEEEYPEDLSEYGAEKDGKGWVKKYEKWQVVEINNLFHRTDYIEDLVILNRELVVGDTLTSQAFDKVANPLLQFPDGALEYDEEGKLTIKIKDRIVVVEPEDKEIKQIQMGTKTEEWKLHRENIMEQIYQNTGTNEQAFGLNKNGSSASGEAKRRDLERTISTVVAKRDRVYAAFEKIIQWGYTSLKNKEIEIKITGKDILSLGVGEKILIAVQGITSGILSVESAIQYINLSDISVEDEMKRIQKDLTYRMKLIESLRILQEIDTEERVAGMIKKQADDLIKELGLDEKEPIST